MSPTMIRLHSPALDALLGVAHPVHAHGFVRVVDYMGNDASIAAAARVSYGRHEAERTEAQDARLIRYLMEHRHTSPSEMARIKLHVKLPLFVANQWKRHRSFDFFNCNEISARYTSLPTEVYVPDAATICGPPTHNKQGRGEPLPADLAAGVAETINDLTTAAVAWVGSLTAGDEDCPAIAPEIARMVGPMNQYTEFVVSCDLHNLLHFLTLRLDSHAQREIRDYAEVIAGIVAQWVPATWAAFLDFRRDAVTLSGPEIRTLREVLAHLPAGHIEGLAARTLAKINGGAR
jgi:thymidylate synthase (FAD)